MSKQAIVIGLGEFGTAMAKTLTARGVQVLAVDNHQEKVKEISDIVDEAVCFDATAEEALSQISPEDRDFAFCTIGDEAQEASIIVTALLRQMGCSHVIARATNSIHARILRLVGAHEVVNPEEEFASWYAGQLSESVVLGEFGLGGGLVLSELEPPEEFFGKTLAELSLPNKYKTTVVAIRREELDEVLLPTSSLTLRQGDSLVVVARSEDIEGLFSGEYSS